MKKIFIAVAFHLLLNLSGFAQTSTENLTSWYNSLKSATKAIEKAKYANQMLEAGAVKDQPKTQYLIDVSLQMVAAAFADENDYKSASEWATKIQDQGLKNGTVDYIAGTLISKKKFDQAHAILDPKVNGFKKDPDGNIIASQQELMTCLSYGDLLFNEGRYRDAVHYLHPAMAMPKYTEKYKELYIRSLTKLNSSNLNKKLIEEVFNMDGQRSEAFKTDVKTWLVKTDGDDNGFRLLEEGAAQKEQNRLESLVAKMAVDQSAPDFEVSDINGKVVTLSSLKGKTVILDFWATWCQPCVASFPGMQKAVNYFKNDPNVVFMFIHTLEKKGADVKKQAQELLTEKGYNFDVFLDLRDTVSGRSPVADKFKIRAIPAKFVINKEGVIKFAHTGYVSEEEAVDEIKLMIQQANKK